MSLPAHRRIITGRTHSRTYYPADYDPVQGFKRTSTAQRIYGAILATVMGTLLAAALIHWWSM